MLSLREYIRQYTHDVFGIQYGLIISLCRENRHKLNFEETIPGLSAAVHHYLEDFNWEFALATLNDFIYLEPTDSDIQRLWEPIFTVIRDS